MTARPVSPVAALTPTRRPQPAAGQSAVAGQPKDYAPRIRLVATNDDRPSEWQDYLARIDADARDPAADLWFPSVLIGMAVFVGGLVFWGMGL